MDLLELQITLKRYFDTLYMSQWGISVRLLDMLAEYFNTLYPSGSGTSTGSNTGDQDLSGKQDHTTALDDVAGVNTGDETEATILSKLETADIVAASLTVTSLITLKGYTVATLPTGTQGDTAFVTDALAPTFLATVVGSGAVVTPVFFNGTNWVGY